jgi:hypothetical protein
LVTLLAEYNLLLTLVPPDAATFAACDGSRKQVMDRVTRSTYVIVALSLATLVCSGLNIWAAASKLFSL